jgi:hypothetical protein
MTWARNVAYEKCIQYTNLIRNPEDYLEDIRVFKRKILELISKNQQGIS